MTTATQIQKQIDDQLSPAGLAYWNGCDQSIIDEMVILGQRQGVEAAVAEIEELARPLSEYEVKTDAVSETIEATSRDEAAAKFSAGEGFKARDEAGLRAEIEAMGGWLNIIEE